MALFRKIFFQDFLANADKKYLNRPSLLLVKIVVVKTLGQKAAIVIFYGYEKSVHGTCLSLYIKLQQ